MTIFYRLICSSQLVFDLKDLKHLGKNVIIGKTVRIRRPEYVSIGDNVIIDDFTYISCAMDLGNNSHIGSNVSISGGGAGRKLIMGSYSTISNGSSIHCASSDYKKCSLDLPSVKESEQFGGEVSNIHISDFVVVGAHSCILPGSNIPEGSTYGAYTLIKPDSKLLPYHLYVGNNCRELGERTGREKFNKFKMEKNK